MPTQTFVVNGDTVTVDVPDDLRVLWVLRNVLGLTGPKYGCGLGGVCRACTCHINGEAFSACSVRVGDLAPTDEILTIEGLADSVGRDLHPAQQAWLEHDVAQCGYCQPGQIMAAVDLVARVRSEGRTITDADLDTIRNVCRCGTYPRIREAIRTTEQLSIGLPVRPPSGVVGTTSRFVALSPIRVADTRPGRTVGSGPSGVVGPDAAIELPVAGVAGVPADATAVVLNVTVTEPAGPGYVTAYPAGRPRPVASSLNHQAGQTRPNLVVVPVGAGGAVGLYSKAAAHLVVDAAGYFTAADGPVASGRFVPLVPSRLFDTRPDQAAPGPKGALAAGQAIDVDVLGVGGVPASGVSAVVVNLTGTQAAAPGYLTAYPTGMERPLASHVNLPAAGATAPNLAIVPVGDDGRITVFASHGAHVLADVAGYLTDATAPPGTAGLFVPLTPVRLFDTRPDAAVGPGATLARQVTGLAGIPAGVAGVALNVTAVDAPTGYVTAWPAGVDRPLASTVNTLGPGDTRANAAWLPAGDGGQVNFFSMAGSHLLADAAGWFLDGSETR